MYPTLPTDDRALTIVKEYLHTYAVDMLGFSAENVTSMLKFVHSNTYARADADHYQQVKGVGTGYHSSGPYAEILVDYTYRVAIQSLPPHQKPITLATYVDDSHSIWKGPQDHIPLLNALNTVWPGEMEFTVEHSTLGRLSFLDLLIEIRHGELSYELFQKPAHSGQYLHFASHCPMLIKINIVASESKRILELCSSMNRAWPHLEKLRSNLVMSGYPVEVVSIIIAREARSHTSRASSQHLDSQPTNKPTEPQFILKVPYTNEGALRIMRSAIKKSSLPIRIVATSGNTIAPLIKREQCRRPPTQDRCSPNCALHSQNMDCRRTHVVYEATFTECGKAYIGATARRIIDRVAQYEASFRLGSNDSTLSIHAREAHSSGGLGQPRIRDYNSFLNNFNFRILETGNDALGTFLREDYHIKSKQPGLNVMKTNGFNF